MGDAGCDGGCRMRDVMRDAGCDGECGMGWGMQDGMQDMMGDVGCDGGCSSELPQQTRGDVPVSPGQSPHPGAPSVPGNPSWNHQSQRNRAEPGQLFLGYKQIT